MRTVLLSVLSIVALAGAPLAAADGAPSAAFTLCSVTPNPLLVQFSALSDCSASAECAPFADVNCSATGSSTSCSSADRDCSAGSVGERGFVTCNGSTSTTKYCGGPCCGQDGVCEYLEGCGCSDVDCHGTRLCPYDCELCPYVTDCQTDADCRCPGSLCTSSGICLCAG